MPSSSVPTPTSPERSSRPAHLCHLPVRRSKLAQSSLPEPPSPSPDSDFVPRKANRDSMATLVSFRSTASSTASSFGTSSFLSQPPLGRRRADSSISAASTLWDPVEAERASATGCGKRRSETLRPDSVLLGGDSKEWDKLSSLDTFIPPKVVEELVEDDDVPPRPPSKLPNLDDVYNRLLDIIGDDWREPPSPLLTDENSNFTLAFPAPPTRLSASSPPASPDLSSSRPASLRSRSSSIHTSATTASSLFSFSSARSSISSAGSGTSPAAAAHHHDERERKSDSVTSPLWTARSPTSPNEGSAQEAEAAEDWRAFIDRSYAAACADSLTPDDSSDATERAAEYISLPLHPAAASSSSPSDAVSPSSPATRPPSPPGGRPLSRKPSFSSVKSSSSRLRRRTSSLKDGGAPPPIPTRGSSLRAPPPMPRRGTVSGAVPTLTLAPAPPPKSKRPSTANASAPSPAAPSAPSSPRKELRRTASTNDAARFPPSSSPKKLPSRMALPLFG